MIQEQSASAFRGICLLVLLSLSGCAVTGPGPVHPDYGGAVRDLPFHEEAVFVVPASWYPNTILGSMSSFHASSTAGTLFITPERLLFAMYDGATNTFVQSITIQYSDVTWITGKQHGLTRILRLRTTETVSSFHFKGGADPSGVPVGKDEVMNYVLDRF